MKYKRIVIGLDQSYKNTGISIVCDGKLKKVTSLQLEQLKCNSDRRMALSSKLDGVLRLVTQKADHAECIIERVRLRSGRESFINIDYIKSIGALNATIVDVCHKHGIKVYSVDTRCWKSQVVGTSKPQANKYGVPNEKWPTVKWCISKGFEQSIIIPIKGKKVKGTFIRNGQRYMYNNDASDSAAIAMFGVIGDRSKLKEEH